MSESRTGKLLPLRRVEGAASDLSDEALLLACSVGDPAALGALYDRHYAAVYRFLARLATTDERDLDDMVQASFVELGRSAGRYSSRAAVRTFLLGIAANIARHQARGEGRRRALSAELERHRPNLVRLPDEAAIWSQRVARLALALPLLPHDLRVAFVMCDLEETPGVEAARVLGVREGTLWRRLHEARKALRSAVEGEDR